MNYKLILNEWNQMLDVIARFDYTKATNIKSQVYGNKMMERVRTAIKKCCAN